MTVARRIAGWMRSPSQAGAEAGGATEEDELRGALRGLSSSFVMTGVFSAFVNVALLTAPLYMLQVYDRVLGSRSESTLVALSILAASMLVVMGVLDWVRSRVLVRAGAKLDQRVGERVFSAVFAQTLRAPSGPRSQYLHDLDGLRQFLTGAASPWLLVKLCGLDALAGVSTGQHGARTRMGDVAIVLHFCPEPDGAPRFDLVYDRSIAKYLWDLLNDAAPHAEDLYHAHGAAA